MKDKVLIIGPWVSGHIQNWLGDCVDFDYKVLTCHKITAHQRDKKIKNLFFITQWLSFLLFPIFCILFYFWYRPKLVHVHFLSSYGILSSILPGKKILSLWGTDVNGKVSKNKLLNFIAMYAIKRYTVINSPANHLTEKLISWGVESDKIQTFQYGIDTTRLDGIKVKPKEDKESNKTTIASIRNWDSLYQVERFLHLWSECDTSEFNLKIFGGTKDKKIEERIISLIEKLDNVELVGFVSQEVFYNELTSCDIFISLPTMDGTPLSVLESLYLGLTPIVTDLPFYEKDFYVADEFKVNVDFDLDNLANTIFLRTSTWDRKHEVVDIIRRDYSLSKNRERMFGLYKAAINSNV